MDYSVLSTHTKLTPHIRGHAPLTADQGKVMLYLFDQLHQLNGKSSN